jgi:transposase
VEKEASDVVDVITVEIDGGIDAGLSLAYHTFDSSVGTDQSFRLLDDLVEIDHFDALLRGD